MADPQSPLTPKNPQTPKQPIPAEAGGTKKEMDPSKKKPEIELEDDKKDMGSSCSDKGGSCS
ncbi:MAG: hypothetical protein ACAH80_02275 [Alphaproteobacteria bacterium]